MALKSQTAIGSTSSSLWTWKMEVYEDSINEDNLTSSVTVISYLGRASGTSTQSFGGQAYFKITCNGEPREYNPNINYGDYNVAGGGWQEVQRETFTVLHNEDGTKSIDIYSSLSTSSFNPNSASAELKGFELTTIEVGTIKVAVDGEYKKGTPYIGLDGEWKKGKAYIGIDGAWKKGA